MLRLGIISDTHYPTDIPYLPYTAIESVFRNVDAILHAGDIETPSALHHLSGIAPVEAVRGDDDNFDLPLTRILEIGGVRVGLTHGHRNPLMERWYGLRRHLGYSSHQEMVERLDNLLRRFRHEMLDVLVFGHSPIPMCLQREGVMLFNPGTAYTMNLDEAHWQLPREPNPNQRRTLLRHIRRYQHNPFWQGVRATVGILEIHENRCIQPHIIELPPLSNAFQ